MCLIIHVQKRYYRLVDLRSINRKPLFELVLPPGKMSSKQHHEHHERPGKEYTKKKTSGYGSQVGLIKGPQLVQSQKLLPPSKKRHNFWAHEEIEETDDPFADDFGENITKPISAV